MTYTHFILVGVDDLKKVSTNVEKKLQKCYEKLREDDKVYPVIGCKEDGWYDNEDVLIKKLKKITTEFPKIIFTFHCFVECGGGSFGSFYIVQCDKLIANFKEDFDRTFVTIKNGDHKIELGVNFNCNDTFVKNNITYVFNKDYAYE